MILKIFIFLVLGYLLFEFVEHIVIPLVWIILKKKRKAFSGKEALLGEVGIVKEWEDTEGMVFVHGELWRATSEDALSPGDKVEVKSVDRLTLIVKPYNKLSPSS